MGLTDLPVELFLQVVEVTMWALPLNQFLRLQLVSRLFRNTIMETIVRGGLLDTLNIQQLEHFGGRFSPYSPYRLRPLLRFKLQFSAESEYFASAVRQSIDFFRNNTEDYRPEDQQILLQRLLDAASMRRLQSEPWSLLLRRDLVKESIWGPRTHSSSNHVLAAMSFIGDEGLVLLYLKDHEVDLRINYAFGGPIQCAASQGHFNIVKLLIDTHGNAEASVPMQSVMNPSKTRRVLLPSSDSIMEALYGAAFGGHCEILQFLADILYPRHHKNFYSGFRVVLRRFACMGGHEAILKELVHKSAPSLTAGEDEGKLEDRTLLNSNLFGWDRWGIDFSLKVIICVGAAFGHEHIVNMAIARGVDVLDSSSQVYAHKPAPALVHASIYGHKRIVQTLLERGAGNKAQDVFDAIVMASKRGFHNVVRLLVDYQASNPDINKTQLLEYAFQAAARCGQDHIIDLLASQGLDMDMSSEARRRAVSAAQENGYSSVARTIARLTKSEC